MESWPPFFTIYPWGSEHVHISPAPTTGNQSSWHVQQALQSNELWSLAETGNAVWSTNISFVACGLVEHVLFVIRYKFFRGSSVLGTTLLLHITNCCLILQHRDGVAVRLLDSTPDSVPAKLRCFECAAHQQFDLRITEETKH